MKYISSAMFMAISAFLLQFYRPERFQLRLSPPPGQDGTINDASAIWMYIPFIISLIILVIAVIEDVQKFKTSLNSK